MYKWVHVCAYASTMFVRAANTIQFRAQRGASAAAKQQLTR
jgi:hypothetical protein